MLFVTLAGDRLGRKRVLVSIAILGAMGGLAAVFVSGFPAILAAAFLGMLNGMGRDRGAHHSAVRNPERQCGYCRFRRRLEPEGDLDSLFAVGGHRAVIVAFPGDMYDPESDLRLDPPRAGSQSVTFGEP